MSSTTKRKRSSKAGVTFPFTQLPKEIQSTIIELACRLRPLPSASTASQTASTSRIPPEVLYEEKHKLKPQRLPVDLDMKTTLSLMLVSRRTYTQVVPTLYSHVFISRPSALHQLQATFASRPQLGLFVKSLHLGPADKKGEEWLSIPWVVDPEDPRMLGNPIPHISATLSWLREEHLIPTWCRDLQRPLHTIVYPPDCRGLAIAEALTAAQRAIDVDLCKTSYSQSKKRIEYTLWNLRAVEAQACLNLYLAEMRRREDGADDYEGSWRSKPPARRQLFPSQQTPPACREGSCGHYPPLELTGCLAPQRRAAMKTSNNTSPSLVISRSEILRHLARPGASTDRFDSPLLFMQSGAGAGDLDFSPRAGAEDDNDNVPPTSKDDISSGEIAGLTEGIDVALPPTATINSLLALARSVLGFAPNISNLSLTGIFERVVGSSSRLPPELAQLESLSLGPPPPHWRTPLFLDGSTLAQVKRLRIAGVMLVEEEVYDIAKLLEGQLRIFDWALADKWSKKHSISLDKIFESLLGSSAAEDARISPQDADDQVGPAHSAPVKSRPLVRVNLHPNDVSFLLNRAPSIEVRTAWAKGRPLPGATRRLMVHESNAAKQGVSRRRKGEVSTGWGILYEEGREWWSREAKI